MHQNWSAIRTQLDITRYVLAGVGRLFLIVRNGQAQAVKRTEEKCGTQGGLGHVKGLSQVFDFIDARPGHFRLMAMMVLTGDLRRDKRGPG